MVTDEGTGEKVLDQLQRRKFTPEYKLRILQEIDSRKNEGHGVVGEILRRMKVRRVGPSQHIVTT